MGTFNEESCEKDTYYHGFIKANIIGMTIIIIGVAAAIIIMYAKWPH